MNTIFETIFADPAVWVACGGLLAVLAAGSLIRVVTARIQGHPVLPSQRASLITWWLLALLLVAATLFGRFGVASLFFAASCLAIREYFPLVLPGQPHRILAWGCYGMIAVHYLLVLWADDRWSVVFLPLGGFLLLNWASMRQQPAKHFLDTATRSHWGLMLAAYGPSHAVMLFHLDLGVGHSSASFFLFLILLTEVNDIAQALVGRSWGKRRITPVISPKKTWEGFLGGIVTTMMVATVLAPWMTPFGRARFWMVWGDNGVWWIWSPLLGLLIAVSGLLGDLTVSAIKRNVGVKDSGNLLPGQGGMLDRIDSLTLTAPAVYYFTVLAPESSFTL